MTLHRSTYVLSSPWGSACLALAMTLSYGAVQCGHVLVWRDAWAPEILLPNETFRDVLIREIARWTTISATAFATTLVGGLLVERNRGRAWSRRLWTLGTLVVFVVAGSFAASFADSNLPPGVWVNLGPITPLAVLITGGTALAMASVLRRFGPGFDQASRPTPGDDISAGARDRWEAE